MNHADSEQVPSCHGVRRIHVTINVSDFEYIQNGYIFVTYAWFTLHAIHDKKRTVYDKNGTFFLCVLISYCKRRYDCLCGQTKELDPDQI